MRALSIVSLLAVLVPGLSWAGVVWRGDFETGNISQYTRAQRVSADRLEVVQSPVTQGRYALKATVVQGDDPINSSGNRNELVYMGNEAEGSEYYYRWQVMFAPDFPSVKTWQLFTQWHHTGCCGSPPVEFFVYGEELRFTLTDSVTPWRTKLERGVWQDFILRVKWSSDPKVGFVELWHNGKKVLEKFQNATMYAGDGIYLKLGLYRNDTVQPVGVVYHDGFVQATRLEDVLPPEPAPEPEPVPEPEPTPAPAPAPAPEPAPAPAPEPMPAPAPAPEPEPSSSTDGTVDPKPVPGPSLPQEPEPTAPSLPGHDVSTLPEGPAYGCSSTGGSPWVLALLGLGGLLRRRRW